MMVSLAIQVRSMIISAIFRKSLRLSASAGRELDSGHILTMVASDTSRMVDTAMFINFGLTAPVLLLVILIMLWRLLGAYMFLGLIVIVVIMPINLRVAKLFTQYRREIVSFTDKRTKLENEMFSSMNVVKMYAWEVPFIKKILGVRANELHIIKKMAYVRSILVFFMTSTPTLTAMITFLVYSSSSRSFDAGTIFSSLALFGLLRMPLILMPFLLAIVAQNAVALRRAQAFLAAPEVTGEAGEFYEKTADGTSSVAVEVKNGSFVWKNPAQGIGDKVQSIGLRKKKKATAPAQQATTTTTSGDDVEVNSNGVGDIEQPPLQAVQPFSLHDISFKVKRGSLVMIVGPVGCGKTSLISGLLNEMVATNGHVRINGDIAYVPQTAWIVNATLRENIVFGREYDEEVYRRVVAASALTADLEQLPAGDETEIGERGINISGGQKQRVSIARALYGIHVEGRKQHNGKKSKKSTLSSTILLLDDPLSAVDSHVAKTIMEDGLLGLANNCTRILVTNQLQFLKNADHVIVLRDGSIEEQGTYTQLVQKGHDLTTLMKEFGLDDDDDDDDDNNEKETKKETNKKKKKKKEKEKSVKKVKGEGSEDEDELDATAATAVVAAPAVASSIEPSDTTKATSKLSVAEQQEKGKLMTTELREQGSVSAAVYLTLMRHGGYALFIVVMSAGVLYISSKCLGDWWLSVWSTFETQGTDSEHTLLLSSNATTTHYLLMYVGFGVAEAVFTVTMALSFALFMVIVSRRLHAAFIHRLSAAPLAFFDVTPIGRILNRLSADLDLIDTRLPMSLQQYISHGLTLLGVLVVVSLGSAFMLVAVFPVAIAYYVMQRYYRKSAIEMQRLEALTRSPVFAQFQQTLQGLAVIRAFDIEGRLRDENAMLLDTNNRAYFIMRYAAAFLAITLGTLGMCIMLAVCLVVVELRTTISPGMVGLTLTYASMLTQALQGLSRQAAETEQHMNGVERLYEYSRDVPQEAPHRLADEREDDDAQWPATGDIVFDNVSVRYRPELEYVLKNLSFRIKNREKIGIVGRTGSGKSSLMNCLLRIVDIGAEHNEGTISIGGDDVTRVGLRRLRRALAIIPQSPSLFTGTIRYNIDPFAEHDDAAIWSALELAGLKDFIDSLEERLDAPVDEGGSNFSTGQCQLLCVARALVRKPKILLLDEASASVDLLSDQIIQKAVRDYFNDCTILIIAHRLHTVMDCDKVMVLDEGRVVEFDAPLTLLRDLGEELGQLVSTADGDDDEHNAEKLSIEELLRLSEQRKAAAESKSGVPSSRSSRLADFVRATGKASSRRLYSMASQRSTPSKGAPRMPLADAKAEHDEEEEEPQKKKKNKKNKKIKK